MTEIQDEGRRVASSMYEEDFLPKATTAIDKLKEPPLNIVKLNNNLYRSVTENFKSVEEWSELFEGAAFFKGNDVILGDILIMVYDDPGSHKMSSVLFSTLGEFHFNSFLLDNKSRFYDACKNLVKESKKSNVRRALAITLLKTYGLLDPDTVKHAMDINSRYEWDETVAGDLASSMKLITSKSPSKIGKTLIDLGFLQPHYLESTLLDVVYEDKPEVIDLNNKLVFLLGQQLEQLFDPLTEYSPESADVLYRAPEFPTKNTDDQLVQDICRELLQLQENITTQLVKFLKEVVVPIRMKTLNGEIKGLTTAKINQVFPPTIDEVTRVNCILLEALKTATDLGSFEVMKACGQTIPYFYKATVRHESALKSFNGNLKDFLSIYGRYIPSEYSEAQIDVILKSQLNLTKIKMILERLVKTKTWLSSQKLIVDQNLKNATDTIDSFGKEEAKPYNKRVFTPSGKILTEVCESWPPALSYGWVSRKVVSIVDTVNQNNREKGVIVLFSDCVVFLAITEEEERDLYASKPQVSDILMNSLVNENPIHNLPSLTVTGWSPLNNLEVTTFGENSITFFSKDGKPSSVFEIEDTSKFMRVFDKALILSKTTPFHLFQIERFGFNVFVTAHESLTYAREHSHTPIALFLNIDPNRNLLIRNKVEYGLFAKFVEDDLIQIDTITPSGNSYSNTINSSELSSFLSEEISNLETKRHSIDSPTNFKVASFGYQSLLNAVVSKPLPIHKNDNISRNTSSSRQSAYSNFESLSKGTGRNASDRVSSYSSVKSNKPLPAIVDKSSKPVSTNIPKKSKLKQRLSKIFHIKEKTKDTTTLVPPPSLKKPLSTAVDSNSRNTSSSNSESLEQLQNDIFDRDIPELSSFDDVQTFETTMSPIFDEELEKIGNFELLNENTPNWILERESSSVGLHLHLKGQDDENLENENVKNEIGDTFVGSHVKQVLTKPDSKPIIYEVTPKAHLKAIFDNIGDSFSVDESYSSRNFSYGNQGDFTKPNSFGNEYSSPQMKFGMESQDMDIYHTPMSSDIRMFQSQEASNSLLDFEFDSFDSNGFQKVKAPNSKFAESYEALSDATSFKSCFEDEGMINYLPVLKNEGELSADDSFRYLAKIVENSFKDTDMKRSETFQTLPRSYSSLKYLASYIDTNFTIDP